MSVGAVGAPFFTLIIFIGRPAGFTGPACACLCLQMSSKNDEYAILSQDQQSLLNQRKIDMRLENEKYLRSHSELKLLVSVFGEGFL